jgi:AcrR family transcriptional regulator
MNAVLNAVAERLLAGDESQIRIPEICEVTGVNYGSVYHHFGSREGVIDAAYEMLFEKLVVEDIEDFEKIANSASTLEGYANAFMSTVDRYALPERQRRRALRLRVVAATLTRPELRKSIGSVQQRLTERLSGVITLGQERGWIRKDVSARAVAAALQAIIIGRTLDDIAQSPVEKAEWDQVFQVFLLGLVNS